VPIASVFISAVTLGNVLATIVICLVLWLLLHLLGKRLHRILEELSGGLLQVTKEANATIEGVNTALHRLELLEARLAATEERVAQLERWQFRALDAAELARAAGVTVPPAGQTPPPPTG
jgi:uncharacterized membrane protein